MNKNTKIEFPLINAVLQKKQQGQIFSFDDFDFVIHKSGFAFIQFKKNNANEVLDFFAKENSLIQYFHIYNPPTQLVSEIKKDIGFGIKYRRRVQLRYKNTHTSYTPHVNKQFLIEKINNNNFDSLKVFGLELENKFWKSKSDFLKNAYGILAIDKKTAQPVAICYSSCLVDNISEIDIVTLARYRGRGLAKIITNAFIDFSIRKNIQVNWDCFQSNTASLRTAQSLGFEQIKEYYFLSIYNKTRDNEN